MRQLFKETQHLFRMAGLFVVGTTILLVLRSLLVPSDFGRYGHFRAGALDDNASQPLVYGGRQVCESCHDTIAEARVGGGHDGVGCESCHGALAAHAEDPSRTPSALPRIGILCQGCHAVNPGKPKGFPQIDAAEHAGDVPCGDCHDPHHPDFD